MNTELKLCPFCGNKEIFYFKNLDIVNCSECGATMTKIMQDEWLNKTVIDKWNIRVK